MQRHDRQSELTCFRSLRTAYQIDPLSQLAFEFDSAGFGADGFTGIDPAAGGLPLNALTDLAVGLD